MHPSALFVPDTVHEDDFEISHLGVVLRRRNGKAVHVAPTAHAHDPTLDAKGKPDHSKPYTVREVPGKKTGLVQRDDARAGWWLVPDKAMGVFTKAYAADVKARKDAEAARLAAGGK
jgi:hypothetical protein